MKAIIKAGLRIVLSLLPAPLDSAHSGPGLHLHWRLGWLRGLFCRFYYGFRAKLGGTRLVAGRLLSVQGHLRLRGPGSVILGDDVIVDSRTDIFTYDRASVVRTGDRCYLNGTRMGVRERVEIGNDVILADVRIMDTDFHSLSKGRRWKTAAVGVAPVFIENNVWIAAGSAVLKGVRIGENSVVGFGSVVVKDIPPDSLAAGNPCRPVGTVPE
jgi:acetyltransferase-like isoleucine patch superfamily enzyme